MCGGPVEMIRGNVYNHVLGAKSLFPVRQSFFHAHRPHCSLYRHLLLLLFLDKNRDNGIYLKGSP